MKKQKKSRRKYKVSTTPIGELIKAQARSSNPEARKNAKQFLKMIGKGKVVND